MGGTYGWHNERLSAHDPVTDNHVWYSPLTEWHDCGPLLGWLYQRYHVEICDWSDEEKCGGVYIDGTYHSTDPDLKRAIVTAVWRMRNGRAD